jgi:hypothetical protein
LAWAAVVSCVPSMMGSVSMMCSDTPVDAWSSTTVVTSG